MQVPADGRLIRRLSLPHSPTAATFSQVRVAFPPKAVSKRRNQPSHVRYDRANWDFGYSAFSTVGTSLLRHTREEDGGAPDRLTCWLAQLSLSG